MKTHQLFKVARPSSGFARFGVVLLLLFGSVAASATQKEAPLLGGLDDLKTLNEQMTGIGDRCVDATVGLVSRGGNGSGSGVIVSEDGIVLTAAHVMAALTDEVIVILPDGRRLEGEKLGADFDRDAAMVRIRNASDLPHVPIGDSKDLRRNDWCVALGHPGGFDPLRTPPLRLGRVLSSGSFLVTDSAVVGGDSGGPLFDVDGRLIGIHSNIGMTLSENRHVPIAVFDDQWDEMMAGKRSGSRFGGRMRRANPDRPVMGVQLGEGGDNGVEVTGVLGGSPADKSGLKIGDRILRIGDKKVRTAKALVGAVNGFEPGDEITVVGRRDGERKTFKVGLVRLGQLGGSDDDGDDAEENEGSGESGDDGAEGGDDSVSAEEKLEKYLDRRFSDRSGGNMRLKLSPEEIEEMGGLDKLLRGIKERAREESEGPKSAESEPETEESPEGDESSDGDKAMAKLDRLIDQAFEEGRKLKLTPFQVEQFGGKQKVAQRLRARLKELGPGELRDLMGQNRTAAEDPFFESTLKALQPVVTKVSDSVAQVLVDGEPAALGTFVNERGWMLTKDLETSEGDVAVSTGKETFYAELIRRFPEHDLALFKVRGGGFGPVVWRPDEPRLGSVLAAAGPDDDPLGIGLVSVLSRPLAKVGYLGVGTEEAEYGIRVLRVMPRSAAAKAGLQAGDVILGLNDSRVIDPNSFGESIREMKAGEKVRLEIDRDGEARELEVALGERPGLAGNMSERFRKMNEMSGRMSERTDGFPMVLQHDVPLDPSQCGGPILDLEGRCLGINVSRAGRVKTYAVPAVVVQQLLGEVDEEGVTDAEMEAVRDLIQEVRGNLDELEDRLDRLERR